MGEHGPRHCLMYSLVLLNAFTRRYMHQTHSVHSTGAFLSNLSIYVCCLGDCISANVSSLSPFSELSLSFFAWYFQMKDLPIR